MFPHSKLFDQFNCIWQSGQYFKRRLALANGIITGGSGVGALAMGPFYHLILSNLGWKILLRILSGLAFLMFVSALFYRPLPAKYNRVHAESKERAKLFDLSVWKIKPFVFLVVSISLLHIGYFIPFIHLVRNGRYYKMIECLFPQTQEICIIGICSLIPKRLETHEKLRSKVSPWHDLSAHCFQLKGYTFLAR